MTMNCFFTNANVSEIVWKFFPTSSPGNEQSIYVNSGYGPTISNSKYVVSLIVTGNNITAFLTIIGVTAADADNTYQCECNIYISTYCAFNKPNGKGTLTSFTTTTTSKIFFNNRSWNACFD